MIVIVMGVAGCGKTTVGEALAARWGATFFEGDAFHPPENRAKMTRGEPLTDDDRWPWLQAIREAVVAAAARGESVVVACSALKASYRELLADGVEPPPRFVYLKLDLAEATRRLTMRTDHFMPAGLAESQFVALEEPRGDRVIEIDATRPVEQIVKEVTQRLQS